MLQATHVLSAEGAVVSAKPGAAPQDSGNARHSAESAIHIGYVESRLQPRKLSGLPQAEGDVAPLAQASTAFAFRMREYFDAAFNQQALSQRSRPARRALAAVVP